MGIYTKLVFTFTLVTLQTGPKADLYTYAKNSARQRKVEKIKYFKELHFWSSNCFMISFFDIFTGFRLIFNFNWIRRSKNRFSSAHDKKSCVRHQAFADDTEVVHTLSSKKLRTLKEITSLNTVSCALDRWRENHATKHRSGLTDRHLKHLLRFFSVLFSSLTFLVKSGNSD